MTQRINEANIVLSSADMDGLAHLLGETRRHSRLAGDALDNLVDTLQIADIVAAGPALEGRVTMDARIRYAEAGTGGGELTVTWPDAAVPEQGRISVLSPLGIALLGRRVGDEVTVLLPHGARRTLTIDAVRAAQQQSATMLAV